MKFNGQKFGIIKGKTNEDMAFWFVTMRMWPSKIEQQVHVHVQIEVSKAIDRREFSERLVDVKWIQWITQFVLYRTFQNSTKSNGLTQIVLYCVEPSKTQLNPLD